ncbi:MAG: hypothetical protein KKA42_04645 [candidate division Zixibacteria bacterium]|nr:hypothetical protein [candidate division Zixibacteria bacterium]
MNRLMAVLGLVLLLTGVATADVARDFELTAGRSSGIVSNFAVDAIAHGTDPVGVWLATGHGVNYSLDGGMSWFVVDAANGLPSENVSAIFSAGNRIWVGSSHDSLIDGELMSLSDALTYSDDNGETWTNLDFSESGYDIAYVQGGDRTVYDITGHADVGFFNDRETGSDADWLFFTAFAGGFLASQDGGDSWRRIYSSPGDSAQFNSVGVEPSYRNRYFSCVADTSHGDSLFVWTGTAGGIFQYVFAPPSDKLFARRVYAAAFCDTCTAEGGSAVFLGTDRGVSRTKTTVGAVLSSFTTDGLPAGDVTAAVDIAGNLFVATLDEATGLSALAQSTDMGGTFTDITPTVLSDVNQKGHGFAVLDGAIYLAAQDAGLLVSYDTGASWEEYPLNPLLPDTSLGDVYCVHAQADTLWVGIDDGLLQLNRVGMGLSLEEHYQFAENDSSSSRVIGVRQQTFVSDTNETVIDSTIIWTVHRPITASGVPFVGRRGIVDDTTLTWAHFQEDVNIYDVNFLGDTAFVMGDDGVGYTALGINPTNRYSIRQYANDSIVVATMDDDTVTTMEVRGDTVVFASSNGAAISDGNSAVSRRFQILRGNTDSLSADAVINYTVLFNSFGLGGNFIPALGVQYRDGELARIWASARPVDLGELRISAADYGIIENTDGDSIGYGLRGMSLIEGEFAWNFAFSGDSAFAATNSGLLLNEGILDSGFNEVPLVDPVTAEWLVDPDSPVYGVGVIDSFLWVGTGDGTVRINLRTQDMDLFARVDSTTARDEVYAFPVPFRPMLGGEVDFHFVVDQPGNVTLSIYDFAMNLVATPIDNEFYDAGIYPGSSAQGKTWDGYNDRGDVVAVGVYYFKVELPGGDVRWGKLAVIP